MQNHKLTEVHKKFLSKVSLEARNELKTSENDDWLFWAENQDREALIAVQVTILNQQIEQTNLMISQEKLIVVTYLILVKQNIKDLPEDYFTYYDWFPSINLNFLCGVGYAIFGGLGGFCFGFTPFGLGFAIIWSTQFPVCSLLCLLFYKTTEKPI